MESFIVYIDKGGIIFTSLFVLSIVTIAIVALKIFEIYLLKRLDFPALGIPKITILYIKNWTYYYIKI